MNDEFIPISPKEFEDALQEIAKVITAIHNRLMRIEEWMLKSEKVKKNEKIIKIAR